MNLPLASLLLLITVASNEVIGAHAPPLRCLEPPSQKAKNSDSRSYGPATQLSVLKDKSVKESSGIAASRTVPGVYWTHNDSGDGPYVYAFDTRGTSRGVWRVAGATATDWEDIAAGPGPKPGVSYLYIGDIGDNQSKRSEIVVYRVPEPDLKTGARAKSKATSTAQAEIFRFRYPDGSHDAEALLVHPRTGNLYIVTKILLGDPGIYEATAPLTAGGTSTLNLIGTLSVPSLLGGIITGGAISPDGRRVAFCDYLQGYEAVLENGSADFNTIWKRPLISISLGKRAQGEAITYRLDSKALLMTSEGSPMPLMQVARR